MGSDDLDTIACAPDPDPDELIELRASRRSSSRAAAIATPKGARQGMGAVRSHVDRATRRSVAIKTMHAEGDEGGGGSRARRGCQSQLERPSIVPVYDIGQTGAGAPFITMKHGESLAHIITRLSSPRTWPANLTRGDLGLAPCV